MSEELKRARIAVSSVFFANGFVIGAWAILVPAVIRQLDITESVMGLIILAGGIAAVVALILAPALIARMGANRVMVAAALAAAPAFVVLQQSSTMAVSVAAFIVLLASLASQDVAMNANAATLEEQAGRPIMAAFHGFWSAGAMAGALIGGPLIAAGGTLLLAMVTAAQMTALILLNSRWLEARALVDPAETGNALFLLPRHWMPWAFGFAAFAAFVSEGAVIDWSAQYLRKELAIEVAYSGLAVGAFSFAMMIGRFIGDRLRARLGDRALFILSTVTATAGYASAATAPNTPLIVAGFVLAGFGNANLVPIAFSGAAKVPGLKKGAGIAAATLCGYAGLLAAPASLGFVGEVSGFAFVYGLMAALTISLVVLIPIINPSRTAIEKAVG